MENDAVVVQVVGDKLDNDICMADVMKTWMTHTERCLQQDKAERAQLSSSVQNLASAVDVNVRHLASAVEALTARLESWSGVNPQQSEASLEAKRPMTNAPTAIYDLILPGAPDSQATEVQPPLPPQPELSRISSLASTDKQATQIQPLLAQQPEMSRISSKASTDKHDGNDDNKPTYMRYEVEMSRISSKAATDKHDGNDDNKPTYMRHEVRLESELVTRWLPIVEASAKIYRVSDVDTGCMTFSVDFVLHLDWYDPNLIDFGGDLSELEWGTSYFNPNVSIDNAKDAGEWLKGADETPRWYPSRADPSRWLRKTMRYKGELFMHVADMRTFPFDLQMLPITIGASPCRALAKVVRNPDGSIPHKDALKYSLQSSSKMLLENDYIAAKYQGSGNFLTPEAGKLLVEFQPRGVSGTPGERFKDYHVNVFVERPVLGSYTWNIIIVILMTGVACLSFWAEWTVSSRMSITLTVILTVAVGTRPDCIAKVPYVTFFDRCLQLSLATCIFISFANIFTVMRCGGHDREVIRFMRTQYLRDVELCEERWCGSTSLDCNFLLATMILWCAAMVYVIWKVWQTRGRITRRLLRQTVNNIPPVEPNLPEKACSLISVLSSHK